MADNSKQTTSGDVDRGGLSSSDSGRQHGSSSPSGFDCNICLELAQDPVVTLCGHLFCWPCLYRWLRGHSTCNECPVCKSLVEEDKLVPLYGRGNANPSDPRKMKPPPAISSSDVPQRPPGQRPPPARPSDHVPHQHHPQAHGFNFMGGAAPMAAARFGNFTFSAGFGLLPSLFGFQMHGFPTDATGFGTGYPFGFPMGFHGAARSSYAPPAPASDQQEAKLSRLLILLGFLVLMCILFL